jgi:serine/threonine protein kinase
LKGLSKANAARNDAVKMIYDISKGMAYLHKRGVLHGDLKVRIPVVRVETLVK